MSRMISTRRDLVRLALSTVSIQLGLMTFEVVDAIVLGELSKEAIAAAFTGFRLIWIAQLVPFGVLLAIDPIISQAFGAGDEEAVSLGMQRGILLCFLIAPVSIALLFFAEPIFHFLDQPPEIIPAAASYARLCALGVVPFLLFCTLRQCLQAMGSTKAILWAIAAANGLNFVLDRGLIHGRWGLPALGIEGAAWASVTSRWTLVIAVFLMGWPKLRPYLRPWRPEAWRWKALLRTLRLGVPLGAQIGVEMGTFVLISFWAGTFGATPMTGHQIVLQLSSVTFMVPLGVSVAVGVAIGQAVGRQDIASARRNAIFALSFGAAFMACCSLGFVLGQGLLPRIWTKDPGALAVAATLLPLAALFQVFDGIQVIAIGVLRGVGDLRSPFLAHFTAFWIIGVPTSYLLAWPGGLGPRGLWWGLVLGLFVGALGLLWMVRKRFRGRIERIVVDQRAERPAEPPPN